MEQINTRLATAGDIDAIVAFNQAMAMETEGKRLVPETIAAGVAAVFAGDDKAFYVVSTNNAEIIGCLMVTTEWSDWRSAWFWWIQSVYIVPAARGRKIYSQMYQFVKKRAILAGNVCGFRLYVETENKNARAVYEKLGMEQSHYLMYEEKLKSRVTD